MNSDELSTTALWAARDLPARLDVTQAAKLLGFAEHDLTILIAARKLFPLGDPAPNGPKWFATVDLLELAVDQKWLHQATKVITEHWRGKRRRKKLHPRCGKRMAFHQMEDGEGLGREVPGSLARAA